MGRQVNRRADESRGRSKPSALLGGMLYLVAAAFFTRSRRLGPECGGGWPTDSSLVSHSSTLYWCGGEDRGSSIG